MLVNHMACTKALPFCYLDQKKPDASPCYHVCPKIGTNFRLVAILVVIKKFVHYGSEINSLYIDYHNFVQMMSFA